MGTLYLMSGPSGAGKTTYARTFAEGSDLQYLGIDDFYRMFNGSEDRHEDEFDVWISYYRAIHLAEQKGRSVIVDTNSPTAAKRTEFLDWFGGYDQKILIFINADPDLCRRNNGSRSRVIPETDMESILRSVRHPTVDEDLRWDEIRCYLNDSNRGFLRYCVPTRDDLFWSLGPTLRGFYNPEKEAFMS